MGNVIELSIVVPLFNEEEGVNTFAERLRGVVGAADVSYEVIFVNDGSSDATSDRLKEICESWPEAKALEFTRNFGHMSALRAGLMVASGRWIGMLDGDMQHPPEVLMQMYQTAEKSAIEVVQSVRQDSKKGGGWGKRTGSRLYYSVVGWLSGVQFVANTADFRIISRNVLDQILALQERGSVFRVILPWFSFPTILYPYEVKERHAGSSKYSIRKMGGLAWRSVIATSNAPLRLATTTGAFVAVLAVLMASVTVVQYFSGATVPGWATLMVSILLLGSVQLLTIGVLGEYVGAILDQVRRRPEFVVNQRSSNNPETNT